MKKLLLIITISLAGILTASAQVDFVSKSTTTDQLHSMSVESGKLVFIDLYATWCGPCKLMDSQVFSRKDVGDYMNPRFISVKYNIEQGLGRQLSEKYGVRSIPTYLIFDSESRLIGKISGAMLPEEFIKSMNKVIANYDKEKKK